MKANAPEKIFLHPDIGDREFIRPWLKRRVNQDSVEYTRTDAFIEKAREWFIEHTNISQEIETNEDGEPLAASYIKYAEERFDAANEIFEDFKNYMKGE